MYNVPDIPQGFSRVNFGTSYKDWRFAVALRYRRGDVLWRIRFRTYMKPYIIAGKYRLIQSEVDGYSDPDALTKQQELPSHWKRR
jgi:hypothetical protein